MPDPEAVLAQRRLAHTARAYPRVGSPPWPCRSRSSGPTTTGCTSRTPRSGSACRTPAAEIAARAEAIRAALVDGGRRGRRRPTRARRRGDRGGARSRPARVPRLRLAGLGGSRAARGPGPGQRRPLHLPAPGPAGRARAARAGGDVGAAGSVLLRHDDADRARHLGGGAGSGRRGAHRGRPRRGRRRRPPTPAAARPATT